MHAFFSGERLCGHRDIILAELIVISRVTGFGQYGCGNEPLEEAASALRRQAVRDTESGRPVYLRAADAASFRVHESGDARRNGEALRL
jgi:hypothetical protein